MNDELTIGAVARRSGLRPSALRYYEGAGLLPAPARIGGQRRYSADIFARLALIRAAREAGFTIAELRTLLGDDQSDAAPPDRWHALATTKLPEVDALIARALVMRRMLETGERCACGDFADCARQLAATGV
jgi:MerR family redox-sensitive transcriptional activator SoxR